MPERLFWRDVAAAVGIVMAALVVWEAAVWVWRTPVYLLPAPSQVAAMLARNVAFYSGAAAVTLGEALGGLCLGVLAGSSVAVGITLWRRWERGVLALAILLKATPMVAIAPLLTLWFGFGPTPKVLVTALVTFFPILVNVHSGLHDAEPALLDLFASWDAGRWDVLRYVQIPAALPYLWAALKVAAPLSLVGAVVAEWAGASAGLGRAMWLAYANLNMPALFAAVFCSATMGVGLYAAVTVMERWIIFWKVGAREE